MDMFDDHGINYMFQSAYRPNHSTETALVKIFNYISLSLGTGNKMVLCLLDLSAAFNTLEHSVSLSTTQTVSIKIIILLLATQLSALNHA